MRIYRYAFLLSWMLMLFTPLCATGQSAKENYLKAKIAIEEGNPNLAVQYLDLCENQLGGSNLRIESMRANCYYQLDDFVKAKIAVSRYFEMTNGKSLQGESHENMVELSKEIDAGLQRAEDEFHRKKKEEKENNLKEVEQEIELAEEEEARKVLSMNEKNERYLYNLATTTRDINALTLYQEVSKDAGFTKRTEEINAEVDKHNNPDKYLIKAVNEKALKEVEYLIGLGGNKDLKDSNGNSLLHLTVETRDAAMQKMLVEKGANLESKNNKDETPLLYALVKDEFQMMQNLAQLGANALAAKSNGATALQYAVVYTTDSRATTLLLKKGGDANDTFIYNDTTMTPLYFATYFRKDAALAQTLLDHRADVNTGKEGYTPLIAAVLRNDPALVKLLLTRGADVNAKGMHGWTALHFAARENHAELVSALLAARADRSAKDQWGRTARNVAYENETKDALRALK